MDVVIVTTDTDRVYLPMDIFMANYNESLSLRVNSKGSFTLHYAIWPFIGLLSLIATVWLLVYILTVLSRRHTSKNEHPNFASFYTTDNSTIAGGCEASNVISPTDV